MTDLKCLTTREVARLCRVSGATVKRWEDAGLLKSERTSGGHRRFRGEEVIRFQREQGLGLKQTHGDDSVIKAAARPRERKKYTDSSLFESLLAGCEESTANTLINAFLQGESVTGIFDDLICPAMRKIGELWFEGEITVTQEHLATRAACNAVNKLRNLLPVPQMSGALAVCCAMEGDFHEFPTHLAQVTIENEGLEVLNFGSCTPLYCLAEEVLQRAPDVICISATLMNEVERLSRDFKDFRERVTKLKIPILLGGRVFEDERIRQRFPAELYPRNFSDLAEFAQSAARRA